MAYNLGFNIWAKYEKERRVENPIVNLVRYLSRIFFSGDTSLSFHFRNHATLDAFALKSWNVFATWLTLSLGSIGLIPISGSWLQFSTLHYRLLLSTIHTLGERIIEFATWKKKQFQHFKELEMVTFKDIKLKNKYLIIRALANLSHFNGSLTNLQKEM